MFRLNNSLRIGPLPVAVAIVALSSWMSGCGDDDKPSGGGKGGSGATSGSAGSATGGTAGTATGGSAGTATGGSAGTATGGSAGMATGGSAGMATGGSAGMATGGSAGMGGEGGEPGMGGEGGQGVGGEGGGTDSMCVSGNLSFMHVSAAPMQQHTHLPVQGMSRTTLVNLINSGMPLTFTMPEDGASPHQHTLTFTAQQLTVLRNGGALAMNITSSMGGPGMGMNVHTHTYSIECEP